MVLKILSAKMFCTGQETDKISSLWLANFFGSLYSLFFEALRTLAMSSRRLIPILQESK